jgi:hypothetical protein
METYSFEVVIGFRVEADNRHDALRAALRVEASLNDSSVREFSSGGKSHAMRSSMPVMRRFVPTTQKLPERPAERSVKEEMQRERAKLDPLTYDWWVMLRTRDGKQYRYSVNRPTRDQAIEAARLKCYHETSNLGLSLVSVKVTA